MKLDRFVKFIENGGIITDVSLYNNLYEDIKKDLEKAEKWDFATKNSIIYVGHDGDLLLDWGRLERQNNELKEIITHHEIRIDELNKVNDELRAQIAKVGGKD